MWACVLHVFNMRERVITHFIPPKVLKLVFNMRARVLNVSNMHARVIIHFLLA